MATTILADRDGFASCQRPIWRVDDFTTCFQIDYLKILLPAIVIGLSMLHLFVQTIRPYIRIKRRSDYDQIPDHPNHTDLPPEESEPLTVDEDEDELLIHPNGGRLSLVKTTTKGSIVQADSPRGENLLVVTEILANAGLVATNIIALVTGTYDGKGRIAAAVGLVAWLYVMILASLRLTLGYTKWRVPRLWNHTASIYACQWLFTLILFRSVLIHASSKLTKILIIVEFCLTTLLFVMAISTRKGNKTVVMEWENDIEPSRESLASVLSLLTFDWINPLLYQGYKEPLQIKHVWNLLPKDKAANILANYRQVKKTSSLALHLVKHFGGSLMLQCVWAVVAGVLVFAPTLLLKAILEYIEMPDEAPRNVLWLYVILLPITDIIRSIADGQALWIGRKVCIRLRAIVIGEIYAKALRRKAASGGDKVLGNTESASKETKMGRLKRFFGLKKKDQKNPNSAANGDANGDASKKDGAKESDEQATLGTIINLMSVDSFKVAECTAYLHFLLASAPTQLIMCIVLLYQVMGLSAIPGLIVMALLLPVNILLARGFHMAQKKIMAATDKRIHTTNETLQNIRIIKYFAWETRFGAIVDEKRENELKMLRLRYMIWAVAVAIWNTVPVVITFFCFLVYTKVEQKPLYPSIAFTAISLFMLLRIPLDQLGDMIAHVQEAKVSVDRVEEYLNEGETDKYDQLGTDNVDSAGNRIIGFRDATFIWGGKDAVAADGSVAFRLLDLDVDFKIGGLNIIGGATGSGKTSMLMALLGEMTVQKGQVFLPGGRSREDVYVDPDTGLSETCAYVAQSAWLVNANIKDNIVFAAPFDEKRYKDVIVACALERDLEILDNGDETLVGENGITLSGGQKQRISLARAVYSSSRHLLLDDCLSAVDSHTAKWIFYNCMKGPLMTDRTCIMVTHNTTLCVPSSDHVVILENGRVDVQGSPQEVIATGKLGEELQNRSRPGSAGVSRVPSRVPSSVGEESGATTLIDDARGSNGKSNGSSKTKEPKKDSMEEGKSEGSVKWPVLKLYLRAMGSWPFWVMTVFIFSAQQLSTVASNLWIKEWANQYSGRVKSLSHFQFSASSHGSVGSFAAPSYLSSAANYVKNVGAPAAYSPATVDEVNVNYYLLVLALIGVAGAFLALIRDLWLFFGSLSASRKLHHRLFASVSRAKFKFFDVTPLGQLMNRFSKDLEAVDQEVAPVAIGVMTCALGIVVTVVLIAAITPGFLVAAIFITVLYIAVGMFYLRASRDLKRLESVHRSPLFQQFGETLSGVTTIRAYGDERRFIRDNLAKINTQARPFIFLWAANRWLAFRTDVLGDLVAFFAGVFVILSIGKIDAGQAGLSLSYAISFSENILWLVRLYAMNEQNMNSVERVKEYLDVEQEAEPIVEKNRPPQNWPAHGGVEFISYSTRYRQDLDPVLKDVTFKIEPREKVGIVGRTGAGKSSLTLAVFRALEADSGKILIDDVDIGQIGLQDLREAITIVPQDPTLFTGTIRTNLDPFDLYTDDEIFTALRRVQLIGPNETTPKTAGATSLLPTPDSPLIQDSATNGSSTPLATNKNVFLDLSSSVAESGSNLSQGQRQLLCLARAMLKNPRLLVMDEATASIDYATDSKIQETIRELTSTIITIAHRLATIVDYDKVLVLDQGVVVEYAHPHELLQKKDGHFRSMCEMSGDLDVLAKAAKKAWDAKKLVDDE